jgi:putative hydrolase of the HAD superfamily
MVSFVWFDIGYTLVYMQREETYRRALLQFGRDIPLEDIKREFHLTDKLFMREYPGVFMNPRAVYMPWYLGHMNFRLGVAVDTCALDACWEEIKKGVHPYWLPYDRTHEVLAALKRDAIGIGVISNWDHSARDVLRDAGLIDYFDHIVISCEVGHNKPHPGIFEAALSQAGVRPEACLYIGDNYYDDAIGSRRVGMDALIINRYGSLGVEEIGDAPIITDLSQVHAHVVRHNGEGPRR